MIQYSYPEGDCCAGVGVGTGTGVRMTDGGKGLTVRVAVAVAGDAVVITGSVGSGTVGILNGSPRSTRMLLLAADEGFSTLMENVLVAVAEDVWNVTTARPSVPVVTSA